jgi:hypothetical protein
MGSMLKFKEFLSEKHQDFLSEGLKAEDYEASIVMGFYELTGRPITDKPLKYGISEKVFNLIKDNPNAQEAGRKIASTVLKKYPELKSKQAEQYGRAKAKLTDFWKSHGASDITPKTDVLIGDMRFSVKIGIAQLMSGGKAESIATFEAATKNSNPELKKSPQYKATTDVLEGFVKSTLAPSQLRPLIKSGTDPVVNKAEKAHKDCMVELNKLFDESKSFKIEFAREAMSGYEKFGKSSNAAAEFMLVGTADGGSVKIHSVDDDEYCLKIVNAMKLQARFKTSSRKIKKVKTGEYNYWSVISLIVDSMQDTKELSETIQLKELKLLKTIRNWMSKTWKKVTSFFKGGVVKLKKFLGAEPNPSFQKKIKF